jgi:NTE family protein
MKFGIVLSGGAVRGLAHIGVLKALEEHGVYPTVISGASAGAIIGVFYADGYSPGELEEIALKTNIFDYIKPSFPPGQALFSLEKLDKFLDKYISKKDLSQLEKKMFVCVTNLNKGFPEYFSSGDIYTLLMATSALPFVFKPVEIKGFTYIDGGITNNLPVEPIVNTADFKIGVDVNPMGEETDLKNPVKILIRSLFLAIRSNVDVRKKYCDIFIQPEPLIDIGLFSTWKMKEAIDIGYRYTKDILRRYDFKI